MHYHKIIQRAIEFATMAHEGQVRKGTDIPYITHLYEAGLIAMEMTDEDYQVYNPTSVIIAAILHDVVEDTDHTLSEIEEIFGSNIAKLVAYESEDKMKDIPAEESWRERKEKAILNIKNAPRDAKIVCLADKLSNIRMSQRTYREKGDAMWEVFNQKDKKQQEWYYRSIGEALSELNDKEAYREYMWLCDYVFDRDKAIYDYIKYIVDGYVTFCKGAAPNDSIQYMFDEFCYDFKLKKHDCMPLLTYLHNLYFNPQKADFDKFIEECKSLNNNFMKKIDDHLNNEWSAY